jgi:CHAT domain-containing protein
MGNPLPTEPANGAIALRTPGDGAAMIPESEAEVRAIARLYGAGRSRVCTQAAATESTFRSAAARYGVVHFATHGVLDDSSAMYSSVLLAPGPSRRDDGRLEAWELMNADLSADLLVLSACETARGDTNAGEGMVGMAWAALVAGCRAVVASQWRVRSDATTQLMVDFHRSWLASSSGQRRTSEALRRASLAMMRRPGRSHPFYWGGFVVVGDGG